MLFHICKNPNSWELAELLKHKHCKQGQDVHTHLFPRRLCRCVLRVSRSRRHMVNCLSRRGQETIAIQVYRHWELLRFNSTDTGASTILPTDPTKPRQSFRHADVLQRLVPGPATAQPAAKHNLTLTPITSTATTHWIREYSHTEYMTPRRKRGDEIWI